MPAEFYLNYGECSWLNEPEDLYRIAHYQGKLWWQRWTYIADNRKDESDVEIWMEKMENKPVTFEVECGSGVATPSKSVVKAKHMALATMPTDIIAPDPGLLVPSKHKIVIMDGWSDPENEGRWRKDGHGHIVNEHGQHSPRGDAWRGDIWPLLQMWDHTQEEAEGEITRIHMGTVSRPSCCQFMLEIYGEDDSGNGIKRLQLDKNWWQLCQADDTIEKNEKGKRVLAKGK